MGDCGVNGVATLDCIFPIIANLITWAIGAGRHCGSIYDYFCRIPAAIFRWRLQSSRWSPQNLNFCHYRLVLVFLSFLIISVIGSFTGVACLGDIAKGTIGFALASKVFTENRHS